MKRLLTAALLLTLTAFGVTLYPIGENTQALESVPLKAKSTPVAILTNSCIDCHKGIEPIRDHQSKMMSINYISKTVLSFMKKDIILTHSDDKKIIDMIKKIVDKKVYNEYKVSKNKIYHKYLY